MVVLLLAAAVVAVVAAVAAAVATAVAVEDCATKDERVATVSFRNCIALLI